VTYTKEVTLWCEADDCQEWVQLNNHESRAGTVSAARIAARREGWTFANGKDHCRKHSTVTQKIVRDPVFDGPSISLTELREQALVRSKRP
jgi:hypothetical protein